MATKPKQTRSMRRYTVIHRIKDELILYSGCEPLTPDDIAEVVVFNAARRENVVVADTLIFPNHQVRLSSPICFSWILAMTATSADCLFRLRPQSCTRSRNIQYGWYPRRNAQEAVIDPNGYIFEFEENSNAVQPAPLLLLATQPLLDLLQFFCLGHLNDFSCFRGIPHKLFRSGIEHS